MKEKKSAINPVIAQFQRNKPRSMGPDESNEFQIKTGINQTTGIKQDV